MAAKEKDKIELIAKILGPDIESRLILNNRLIIYVKPESLRRVLIELKDHKDFLFDILRFMTAVDYAPRDPRFELVYELCSTRYKHCVRIKCLLSDTGSEDNLPVMDTVSDLFLTANWHERECYDLFGINFAGHPDLRRIVLPEQWDGFPLRKEYPFDGKPVWKPGCSVDDSQHMEGDLGL